MKSEPSYLQKARFYLQTGLMYVLAVGFTLLALRPAPSVASADSILKSQVQVARELPPLIMGKPTRLVIPDSGIDLTVEDGIYNPSDKSWTLSGYNAHYALFSYLANNRSGMTFIYGHNNNSVFGALRRVTPTAGAKALIYADNGRIFEYSFESSASVTPNDTSILKYQGPPILVIMTCTGTLNEWRTIYKFNFVKVDQ